MEAADVHTYCNLAVSPPQHRAGRLGWAVLVLVLFAGVELPVGFSLPRFCVVGFPRLCACESTDLTRLSDVTV